MQESYQEEVSDSSDVLCQLNIFVDSNGEVLYTCDWDTSNEGIVAISSVFYRCLHDSLLEKIFNEVQKQCVLDGNDDIHSVVKIINQLVLENGTNDGDTLVVPPTRV